jgi:trans-aconitate methyltransferase
MANAEYMTTTMEIVRAQRIAEIIQPYVRGKVLEVGCGIGLMTDLLAEHCVHLTALDNDTRCISEAMENIKARNVTISVGDFMRYPRTSPDLDLVVMTNVLEHVDNPEAYVHRAVHLLTPHVGTLIVSVPNAHSLHRKAGVLRGVIPEAKSLGPSDMKVGHKRVFDLDEIITLMQKYFPVTIDRGSYYKIYPNKVMEDVRLVHPDVFDAAMRIEPDPNLAADIIVIGEHL